MLSSLSGMLESASGERHSTTLQLRARASLVLVPEREGRPRPAARPRWAVTRAAPNVTSHEKYNHNKKTGNVANAPYSDR